MIIKGEKERGRAEKEEADLDIPSFDSRSAALLNHVHHQRLNKLLVSLMLNERCTNSAAEILTCHNIKCGCHPLLSNAVVQYTRVQAGVILLCVVDIQRPVMQNLPTEQYKKLSYRRDSARCVKWPFKLTQGHPLLCQSTRHMTSC